MILSRCLYLALLLSSPFLGLSDADIEEQTCTWEERETCEHAEYRDPHLKPMVVNLEGHPETTFYAFVDPDVATFYNETPGSIQPKETNFKGFFGKFINLSKNPVKVFWVPTTGRPTPSYISGISPFGAAATATYPGHKFIVTEQRNEKKVLTTFTMQARNSLYTYDPYGSLEDF